jgi:AcrR family transcriptional regulator
MKSQLNIILSKDLYIKDPTSSDLGRKILIEGLNLLFEIGLEGFTFKKLATKIETTESTIYRYFDSKNQFLFYLFNYYWSWMEIQLQMSIANIINPKVKLKNAIKLIAKTSKNDCSTPYIDEGILQKVLMIESSKIFLTKKVDEENNLGFFKHYKQFVQLISEVVLEINPKFPYSHTLVSTVIESLFHQRFFVQHLPSLSDNVANDVKLEDFFYQMSIHTILNYKKNGKI